MAAASIRPESAGVVLSAIAFLQKEFPGVILDQNGDSPVLQPIDMRLKLGCKANVLSIGVNKHHHLVLIDHNRVHLLMN
jgi:hypothetical protein